MAAAQVGQDVQTVHARQQNIHEHDVEGLTLRTVQPLRAILAPGDLKAAAVQLIVHESTEHRIVLDGEYAGALNAGGIHWRLRVILKPAIIQDCVRLGNGD
jgi:hypothetical protein